MPYIISLHLNVQIPHPIQNQYSLVIANANVDHPVAELQTILLDGVQHPSPSTVNKDVMVHLRIASENHYYPHKKYSVLLLQKPILLQIVRDSDLSEIIPVQLLFYPLYRLTETPHFQRMFV